MQLARDLRGPAHKRSDQVPPLAAVLRALQQLYAHLGTAQHPPHEGLVRAFLLPEEPPRLLLSLAKTAKAGPETLVELLRVREPKNNFARFWREVY